MDNGNKRLIAVILFIVFISVSVIFAMNMDSKEEPKKNLEDDSNISSNSNVDSNIDSNIDDDIDSSIVIDPNSDIGSDDEAQLEVGDSRPVQVVTSNTNKNSNITSNGKNIIPVSYFITQIYANKIYVGGTTNILVSIKPENATIKKITYTSSNPGIATVASNGKITGISPGTCEIKVSVEGAGVSTVTVQVLARPIGSSGSTIPSTPIPPSISNSTSNNVTTSNKTSNNSSFISVTGVKLNKSSLSLQKGNSTVLTATITPSNASNKGIFWTTSNSAVASVQSGIVYAKGYGTATITATTADGNKKATCIVTVPAPAKNGWYTENGNKYYYRNNQKLKNQYIEYIYLDSNGVAQNKIGTFDATLYGARAWANQALNIMSSASDSSKKLGTVPLGGKMTIVGDESGKFIKIQYGNIVGYVYNSCIYINLPDIVPDAIYEITNANASIFKSADEVIPGITGANLYGYSKAYNEKIGKTTYYAPLLYPVAKEFQNAYHTARSRGFNLKVYDSYRPYDVTKTISTAFKKLYNQNPAVKSLVNKDKNGQVWGTSWFLAEKASNHNKGIALDLTITDSSGKELSAQTPMHTLDTRALRKYNNDVANKLSDIMTSSGFETLASEWWHYEEKSYSSIGYTSIAIR